MDYKAEYEKLLSEREEWLKFAEAMEKRVADAQRQRDEMEELMLRYQHDYHAAMENERMSNGRKEL